MSLAALSLLLSLTHLAASAIIDLSHPMTSETFYYADVRAYNRTMVTADDDHGLFVDRGVLEAPEHSGTHIDAPRHFVRDGWTLEDIPVEATIADGVNIDCRQEARLDRNYAVPIQKILDWESAHGIIPQQAAILFNFGWSAKYNDLVEYLGTNHRGLTNTSLPEDFTVIMQPALSAEAGEWLLKNRRPKIVAVDTLTPDKFQSNFEIHVGLLSKNGLIVENLRIPDNMPARGFRFHATPPKYRGGSGTQVRAFAVTSYDDDVRDSAPSVSCSRVLVAGLLLVMAALC